MCDFALPSGVPCVAVCWRAGGGGLSTDGDASGHAAAQYAFSAVRLHWLVPHGSGGGLVLLGTPLAAAIQGRFPGMGLLSMAASALLDLTMGVVQVACVPLLPAGGWAHVRLADPVHKAVAAAWRRCGRVFVVARPLCCPPCRRGCIRSCVWLWCEPGKSVPGVVLAERKVAVVASSTSSIACAASSFRSAAVCWCCKHL